jgi:hypothetical protein
MRKIKFLLGLCQCDGCFRIAKKHLSIFCVNMPVCNKHYKKLCIREEDIFED